jgi:hypothetical protein
MQTPGADPITSIDEPRNDALRSDEELDEFLAFVTQSRGRRCRTRPGNLAIQIT